MTVLRSHADHQTRYELRDDDDAFVAALTYTADPSEPATWKILLPGPGGTEDLYGTQRITAPDAGRVRSWLTPLIGEERAGELAGAVDTSPPPTASWSAPS